MRQTTFRSFMTLPWILFAGKGTLPEHAHVCIRLNKVFLWLYKVLTDFSLDFPAGVTLMCVTRKGRS